MEEKLIRDLDKIFLSIAALVIGISGSIFCYHSPGWWLPAVGGIFSIIGLINGKNLGIDLGVLISSSSFFYLMHDLRLTYGNLFFILATFFLYFGLWLFMRRAVLIDVMENDLADTRERNSLAEYKEDSGLYLLWTLFLGSIVASIGSLIAIYSFVGPFPSGMIIFLTIFFSIGTIFAVYTVVILLPKHFTVKDSR